jgi:ABC-type dipeptide/oligopeptide/nickel transport system permease component
LNGVYGFVYRLRWFPFAALHSVPHPEHAVTRVLVDASSFVLPSVTTQAAMVLVDSLCADFLVERVFARPSQRSLLWRAIQLDDVTCHLMDPRIRVPGAAG